MDTNSKTSMRVHEIAVETAYHRLANSHELVQMDSIANHYVSVVETAKDIRFIIDNSKVIDNETMEILRHLTEKLKVAHAHSLGLELKWELTRHPFQGMEHAFWDAEFQKPEPPIKP